MALTVPSNGGFISIDTTTSKTFQLPLATELIGRVLTFKDKTGNASNQPIILQTQGGDTFQNGINTYYISESFGSATFVSRPGQWILQQGNTQVIASSVTANYFIGDGSLLTNLNAISSLQLTSTVEGLGTYGYVSTLTLFSTTAGLQNYISTFIDPTELASTVVGIGSAGFISSIGFDVKLASTVAGLGTAGYIYSLSLYSSITGSLSSLSKAVGPVVTPSNLFSTVDGLGTAGYISSLSLYSSITGSLSTFSTALGPVVTPSNLFSTVDGLGTAGYVSTPSLYSSITGSLSTFSTALGPVVSPSNLFSTVAGLGQVYISSFDYFFPSTVIGLGTSGYVSTASLASTTSFLQDEIQYGLSTLSTAIQTAGSYTAQTLYLNQSVDVTPYKALGANEIVSNTLYSTITSVPGNSDSNLLCAFQTDFSLPTFIPSGIWDLNLFVDAGITGSILYYYNLYFRASGGAESLLFQSKTVPVGNTGIQQYTNSLPVNYTPIPNGSTIVMKVYGSNINSPTRTVTCYFQDGYYSHVHTTFNSPSYSGGSGISSLSTTVSENYNYFTSQFLSTNFNLYSTVAGLGTAGYVSTASLYSSIAGSLSSFSTAIGPGGTNMLTIISTVEGLGTAGYVSTASLYSSITGSLSSFSTAIGPGGTNMLTIISTVEGLGTAGYVSTASLYSSINGSLSSFSTAIGPGGTNMLTIISTVEGLGTAGYVSTASLYSSINSAISSFSTALGPVSGGGGGGSAAVPYLSSYSLSTGYIVSPLRIGTLSTVNAIQYNGLFGNYNNTVLAEISTGGGTQELLIFKGSSASDRVRVQTTGSFVVETGVSARLWNSNTTQTLSNATPAFIINTSSNVGIQTATPGAALDVAGTARAVTLSSQQLFVSSVNGGFPIVNAITNNSVLVLSYNSNYFSYDGNQWLTGTGMGNQVQGLGFNGSFWVAGSEAGTYRSGDGITWGATSFTGTPTSAVAWNGTIWVIGGYYGNMWYSYDGYTWIQSPVGPTPSAQAVVRDIAWGNDKFVAACAGAVYYSYDGLYWYNLGNILAGSDQTFCVAYNGLMWVIGGRFASVANIAYSYDGIRWINTSVTFNVTDIAWSGSIWVAVTTTNQTVLTSPDGITWTSRTNANYTDLPANGGGSVTWNGSYFYAASGNSIIYLSRSSDGITWRSLGTIVGSSQMRKIRARYALPLNGVKQPAGIYAQNIFLGISTNQTVLRFPGTDGLYRNTVIAEISSVNTRFAEDLVLFKGSSQQDRIRLQTTGEIRFEAGVPSRFFSSISSIASIAVPAFIISTNSNVGIGTALPAATLDVVGTGRFLAVSTLALNISSINGQVYSSGGGITIANLASTIDGLGTVGYVSTVSLYSSINGSISSFSTALGNVGGGGGGGITTSNLVSTVEGLGTTGYVSTLTLDSAISSFSTALGNVGGGGGGGITTSNLASTVEGLGTSGYISTQQLASFSFFTVKPGSSYTGEPYGEQLMTLSNISYQFSPVVLGGDGVTLSVSTNTLQTYRISYMTGVNQATFTVPRPTIAMAVSTPSNVIYYPAVESIDAGGGSVTFLEQLDSNSQILFYMNGLSNYTFKDSDSSLYRMSFEQVQGSIGQVFSTTYLITNYNEFTSSCTFYEDITVKKSTMTSNLYVSLDATINNLNVFGNTTLANLTVLSTATIGESTITNTLYTNYLRVMCNAIIGASSIVLEANNIATSNLQTSTISLLDQSTMTYKPFFISSGSIYYGSNLASSGGSGSNIVATGGSTLSSLFVGSSSNQNFIKFWGSIGEYNNTVIAQQSTGGGSDELMFFQGSTINDQFRFQTTGSVRFETGVSQPRNFCNANQIITPTVLINSSSNVGILTNNPTFTLDVTGSGRFTTLVSTTNTYTGSLFVGLYFA
jgi:hypothetical protein